LCWPALLELKHPGKTWAIATLRTLGAPKWALARNRSCKKA
jgi:hypothetical protein